MKDMSSTGFQHVISTRYSKRKNLEVFDATLNECLQKSKKSKPLNSETMLQQRKSMFRILKDKFIGQQVIKVLEYVKKVE